MVDAYNHIKSKPDMIKGQLKLKDENYNLLIAIFLIFQCLFDHVIIINIQDNKMVKLLKALSSKDV